MDWGRLSERAMAMDEATWARHANPWSGWTRIATLPLFALAVWSRVWLGWWALVPVALVMLWTWINPRLFPPPRDHDAWMTRGVLGERIWLARRTTPIPRHHEKAAQLLAAAAGLGLIPLAAGLILLDPGLTLGGLAISMGGKLWFLDRMVWLHAGQAR